MRLLNYRPILVLGTFSAFETWILWMEVCVEWIVVELISYALILVTLALYSVDIIVVCDRNSAADGLICMGFINVCL